MLVVFIVSEIFFLIGLGYSIWLSNSALIILEIVILLGVSWVYYQCKKEEDKNSFLAMVGIFLLANSFFIYATFKYAQNFGHIGEYKNFLIAALFFVLGIVKVIVATINNFYGKLKKPSG